MLHIPDIEVERTPSDLRQYVIECLSRIVSEEESKNAARMWIGEAKYLLREILPLSHFAPWRWPNNDVMIKPKIGNQGYDAVVRHLESHERTELEVSWPIHGREEKADAIALNQGRIPFHSKDTEKGQDEVIQRVRDTATQKALKDYGSGILVLVFDVWPAFLLDIPNHTKKITLFLDELRTMTFKAAEVYLMLSPPEYVASKLGSAVETIMVRTTG